MPSSSTFACRATLETYVMRNDLVGRPSKTPHVIPSKRSLMKNPQVNVLLECLKNPTLVWEMCGDISMIQELCDQDVGFVYLHQRRLEILRMRTGIVSELHEKAFKDFFPNGVIKSRKKN
ncbi:hypothetical protein AgCh_003796 [Apium graveolens]